jgi:hypothetical protein
MLKGPNNHSFIIDSQSTGPYTRKIIIEKFEILLKISGL